jgi:hypothetical protein
MANTYTAIASQTVTGSSVATVTFGTGGTIPQTYTDLVLVINGVNNSAPIGANIRVGNGSVDSGTNYSKTGLTGNGSAAASYRGSNETSFTTDNAGDVNGGAISISHFMNYSNATTYKTMLNRNNDVNQHVRAIAYLWRSTSAINIMTVTATGSTSVWDIGTTMTLYGIKAA